MYRAASRVDEIVGQLRTLINELSAGDGRLPSEPQLASQVGASRATVRQALAMLEVEGLVTRRHGIGTFVNKRVLNIGTRLEEVWDFFEMIEMAGHQANTRNHFLTLGPPSPDIARKLCLSPIDEVIAAANVFLADDVPVIYCIDYLPASLVSQAYRDEELYGPVYEFMARRCDERIDTCIAELLPVVADDALAALLKCQPGSPLHLINETGFNARGTPIICSEEYYLPEFVNFTVLRKMTSRRE